MEIKFSELNVKITTIKVTYFIKASKMTELWGSKPTHVVSQNTCKSFEDQLKLFLGGRANNFVTFTSS